MALNLVAAGTAGGWLPDSGESDMRKKIAQAMALQAMKADPIQSKWQAAAQMGQGLVAGLEARRDADQNAAATQQLMNLPGLGGGAPPAQSGGGNIFSGIAKALSGGFGGAAPAAPEAAAAEPVNNAAAVSAAGETGVPSFDKQGQISPDTGGSKSYGVFGLNTWGKDPNATSAGKFAATYGKDLGFTAPVGSPEFDAQWQAAAANNPEGLKAAQLDWHQKNIVGNVASALAKAGVPAEVAADPRVQSYFADRMVQQGAGSTVNHAPRISSAFAGSNNDPGAFLARMSAADKAALPQDFRTYLSENPNNVRGLQNRVDKRQNLSMGMEGGNAPVRVASLGGMPQGDSPAPAAQPPVAQPVQLAQAGGQLPQVSPQRNPMTIPPEVGQQIRSLMANPRTRQYGMQLYQQYAKPPAYEKLNDDTLFDKSTGATKTVTDGYRPIVDPAERAKYGIPTHDSRPYQLGPAGKLINPPPETRVNIDQKAESAFDTQAATHQVKRFDSIVQNGFDAKSNRADVNALREIGARIPGGTGKTAEIQTALGPYAEALGVKVEGLGDMQAYEAIVNKMAPRMRAPGSGSTSDFEGRQFLKGLPSLGKTPEGNAIIEDTMTALQDHQEKAAEIASRALNKELTPRDADKALRELPDPWTAFKEYRKTQAGASSAPPPAPNGAPSRDEIEQEMRRRNLLK